MRFGTTHDQEDEAARLLLRKTGVVAVWSDGSVSWFRWGAVVLFASDAPIYIKCPLPDGPARRAYTGALREWFSRRQQEQT